MLGVNTFNSEEEHIRLYILTQSLGFLTQSLGFLTQSLGFNRMPSIPEDDENENYGDQT